MFLVYCGIRGVTDEVARCGVATHRCSKSGHEDDVAAAGRPLVDIQHLPENFPQTPILVIEPASAVSRERDRTAHDFRPGHVIGNGGPSRRRGSLLHCRIRAVQELSTSAFVVRSGGAGASDASFAGSDEFVQSCGFGLIEREQGTARRPDVETEAVQSRFDGGG